MEKGFFFVEFCPTLWEMGIVRVAVGQWSRLMSTDSRRTSRRTGYSAVHRAAKTTTSDYCCAVTKNGRWCWNLRDGRQLIVAWLRPGRLQTTHGGHHDHHHRHRRRRRGCGGQRRRPARSAAPRRHFAPRCDQIIVNRRKWRPNGIGVPAAATKWASLFAVSSATDTQTHYFAASRMAMYRPLSDAHTLHSIIHGH